MGRASGPEVAVSGPVGVPASATFIAVLHDVDANPMATRPVHAVV
jgi:hypothetical protein